MITVESALYDMLRAIAKDQYAGNRDYSWLMDEILEAEHALRKAGKEPPNWEEFTPQKQADIGVKR